VGGGVDLSLSEMGGVTSLLEEGPSRFLCFVCWRGFLVGGGGFGVLCRLACFWGCSEFGASREVFVCVGWGLEECGGGWLQGGLVWGGVGGGFWGGFLPVF